MSQNTEDMDDGRLLKEAVKAFNESPSKERFIRLLELLAGSNVWIPATAKMSDRDWEAVKNSDVGDELTTQDCIRFVPDVLLQKDGQFFFPVFSDPEEMGEAIGSEYSRIPLPFSSAVSLARGKEKDKEVAGIVLDAFTEPFELGKELFDAVEGMLVEE